MWYNDLRPKREIIPNKYTLTFYDKLNGEQLLSEKDKKRALTCLIKLKKGLAEQVPSKKVENNILIASWNIKEFGHLRERLPESYFYIAEIINAFDIVAIQEIKRGLDGLNNVMDILGSNWSYIMTDITEGKSGNRERFGFIYDTRRVRLSGLSGELVMPPELSQSSIVKQLKRTPSITGFETGWKKFSVVSMHLHPGDDPAVSADPQDLNTVAKPSDHDLRKSEVELLMALIKLKLDKKRFWNDNLILLGDTNLYESDEDIVKLITDMGFKESEGLIGKFTNTSLNQIYDRIFFKLDRYFKLIKDENGKENGGVFNLYDYVFTDETQSEYKEYMLKHKDDPSNLVSDEDFKKYYNRYWKRNQISDHLPVWIEIESNSSLSFLKSKASQIVTE